MEFKEKALYHQVHPLKLATDIVVVPVALYFLWNHRILSAALVALVPPVLVSAGMMKWTPDLNRLKNSPLGHYVKENMTRAVEAVRLSSLIPMSYGAWVHNSRYIVLGLVILVIAWCNGLIFRSTKT